MKKLILSLCLGLFFALPAKATHLMGAEITYVRTGQGLYDVYVKVIRDCNGIGMASIPLEARNDTTVLTFSTSTKLSVRDITPLGPNCPMASRCTGSSLTFGMEEHVWVYSIDLSAQSECLWTLVWKQSSRTSSITTGAASQNYCVQSEVNQCVNNTSPYSIYDPLLIMCHNQDLYYDLGVRDTVDQGDSFSYELVPALQDYGVNCTYSGNFSATRPFTFFGFPNQNLQWPAGFHLDKGVLTFRPTMNNQVGIIAVEIKEWRKDQNGAWQQIGYIRRDMQVAVTACANNVSPSVMPPYSVAFCENEPGVFNIVTEDNDNSDSTFLEIYFDVPGAIVTVNNGQQKWATGSITWTPGTGMASSIPYVGKSVVRDNACPFPGHTIRAFSIFVRDTVDPALKMAGPDIGTQLQDTVKMNGAALGYGQQAYWKSSGDGYFLDSFSRNATYVNGPMDKLNCSIPMYRIPYTFSACGPSVPDTMVLIRVIPKPDAGNDRQSPSNDSVLVTGIVAGPLGIWSSLGDGYFTDSTGSNAVYHFGTQDVANCGVDIILSANPGMTCSPVEDTVHISLRNEAIHLTAQFDSLSVDSIVFTLVSPYGSTVTWSSLGGGNFTVGTNGKATYFPDQQEKDAGMVEVIAEQQGPCGIQRDTLEVFFTPAGLPAVRPQNDVRLYPNPANGSVSLIWEESFSAAGIQLLDPAGRHIRTENLKGESSGKRIQLHGLAPGTYFIKVSDDQGNTHTLRLTIQ